MDETETAFLQEGTTNLNNGQNLKVNSDEGQRASNFEDVISAMGPPGRYQITQCILLGANILPSAFTLMNFVFIGLEPSFQCSSGNEMLQLYTNVSRTNETGASPYQVVHDKCEIRVISGADENVEVMGCLHGYSYDGGKHVSIMSEWDLVCDRRGTAELTQTTLALGRFIGLFFVSAFSDKFGRKRTLVFSIAATSVSQLICYLAPNIYVMICLRFCLGLLCSGIASITFVLGAEMLVSKHREVNGVYIGLTWSLSSTLLCGIGYIFRDSSWRDLQLCIAICCMLPLITMYFVDESPSWLYSRGRFKKATRIIQKSCRQNGIDYKAIEPTWDKLCEHEIEEDDTTAQKAAKDYNVMDMFRDNRLRASVLIAWITCFSNDVAYFGMYLSASTLVGNLYLNTAIMGMLEFPGCLLVLLMLRYYGRRFVTMFFMAVGAACLLVSTCLGSAIDNYTQHVANTTTAFFLLGRLAISNSYVTFYLYVPELFPTTLRSSGYGISFTGGCLGGMLAPYLLPLHEWVRWVPGTFLIVVLAISIVLMLKLPETKGKQLVSTIEASTQSNEASYIQEAPGV